jgi:hypothetical protein
MRRGEFGWHDDHLMKNLAVALALAVISASVVDSLVGAVIPYKDSLKLTCAEAKADMPEIDGATLGRPTTCSKADGGGCHPTETSSRQEGSLFAFPEKSKTPKNAGRHQTYSRPCARSEIKSSSFSMPIETRISASDSPIPRAIRAPLPNASLRLDARSVFRCPLSRPLAS